MKFRRLYRVLVAAVVTIASCGAMCVSAQDFAESSVLREGVWQKVSVSESGIYCLTKQQLQQMGFTDPSAVRVYGSGGNQISFVAGADSRDDLVMAPTVRRSDGSILFYAEGPDGKVLSGNAFVPSFNSYSKKSYYYLTSSTEESDAAEVVPVPSEDPMETLTTYTSYCCHALRSRNIDGSGRDWVGESLSYPTKSMTVDMSLPCRKGARVYMRGRVATLMNADNRALRVKMDGAQIFSGKAPVTLNAILTETAVDMSGSLLAQADGVEKITIECDVAVQAETVWLTYMTLTSTADLVMSGDLLTFRNTLSLSYDGPVGYALSGAKSSTLVWDVTDATQPKQMTTSYADGTLKFAAEVEDNVREFVAFNPEATFPSPTAEGSVKNHNLHADQSVNYLILGPSIFEKYAKRLGELHEQKQGLSWRFVDVSDVYDEFSAGRAEAPGLRNYIKMLYERGKGTDDELKYVLLFGEGSYNNFNTASVLNRIPTYESETSYGLVTSYCTDDFYGWLEDGENTTDIRGTVDVGIGRLPASTEAEAEILVSKIEQYVSNPPQGNWRGRAVFIGCSGDANEHVDYSEKQASAFETENPDLQTIRIFTEAYPRVSSSTGMTFPEATALLNQYLQDGVVITHYTGHGGYGSTGDGYMKTATVEKMANGGRQNFIVAATCTFAPFDQQHKTICHAGMFNQNGGFIGVFTTSREVYGNGNYLITRPFMRQVFAKDENGKSYTCGDAMKYAKRNGPKGINSLKYNLLCDPAVVLQRPIDGYVALDKVNGVPIEEQTEPLMALSQSTIEGSVRDAEGQVDESFNGTAFVTLYDKRNTLSTSGAVSGTPYIYSDWNSRIFTGEVDVVNGHYTCSFMLAREINLEVGNARLHVYASSKDDARDVVGADERILVGDIASSVVDDEEGPEITMWIDYEEFVDGQQTTLTPTLYATISDPSGINVSGQGVGHDLSLVVDGDRAGQIVVNDKFVYESGSYTRGTLTYKFSEFAVGAHTVTLKAWDNMNNSSTATVKFNAASTNAIHFGRADVYVSDGKLLVSFSHDCGGEVVSLRAGLYTLDGRKVVGGDVTLASVGNTTGVIDLTSRVFGGKRIGRGLYVLRCEVDAGGRKGEFSKKLLYNAQ